jgi:hypothetical protein
MNKSEERQQFLNDVLITAVEGGINYWAAVSEYRWDGVEVASVRVHEFDEETGDYDKEGVMVMAGQLAGPIGQIIADGSEINLADDSVARIFIANRLNDAGEIDAGDADAIMQVAVLGDVVYG